jgi:hypothetical protein
MEFSKRPLKQASQSTDDFPILKNSLMDISQKTGTSFLITLIYFLVQQHQCVNLVTAQPSARYY